MILKLVIYIGPLSGGTIAVFFMFKPLLARSPKRATPIELNPAQHPRLYQFIAHLSDLLGVSVPKRIYLDCDLNASAGFRRGWLSFLGNDLVLNLGLPLVAGLNTRQFAAVVSHELGHCTQWLEQMGYGALNQIWQKRHQLPDSLPDFLDKLEGGLPDNFHENARLTLLNETAGVFATHPTAAQRIQKARRRYDPGVFAIEKPARQLFRDFAATAQVVTARHYRQNLRLAVTNPMLKPVGDFFQQPKPVASEEPTSPEAVEAPVPKLRIRRHNGTNPA